MKNPKDKKDYDNKRRPTKKSKRQPINGWTKL